MSEELAEYGAAERAGRAEGSDADAGMPPAEARMRGGPYGDGRTPLVTTIRWHRPAERLPAYGVTVVVWIPKLALVMRALRDDDYPPMWRIADQPVIGIRNDLVAAWTDAPNGPLPPPDGGAA